MAPLNLLSVVSASLLVLTKTSGALGGEPTYAVTLGGDGECLTEINAARESAGLSALVQAATGTEGTKRLPQAATFTKSGSSTYDKWIWYPVCETLLTKNTPEVAVPSSLEGGKFPNGTYGFYQADADSVDCKSVLKKWKDAYKNFDGLPPTYSKQTQVYKNPDNVSLIAMYNPSNEATADCRMVTCKKTVTDTTPQETKGYALICLTVPDALNKASPTAPPFKQEQWDKIVSAIKSSASATSPSVVGLVAALLGFAMMML